jgi:hypothetical protein
MFAAPPMMKIRENRRRSAYFFELASSRSSVTAWMRLVSGGGTNPKLDELRRVESRLVSSKQASVGEGEDQYAMTSNSRSETKAEHILRAKTTSQGNWLFPPQVRYMNKETLRF